MLAFLGPVGFVRKYVRKFEVWIVLVSLIYLAWWSLHGQHPVRIWHRGGAPAFWPGFDLVLASVISWTPLVADYTRFARTRRDGFVSAGLGYFIPTVPLFALGAMIALSRGISDAPGLLTAIAAGGVASVLALLALTVDESDEAFANVYSGAVSLQNLLPNVPQRLLVGGFAAISTIGALAIDLRNYQPFLYLLGSFFVPLFAVLLADWLLSGRHYDRDDDLPRTGAATRDDRRLACRVLPLPVADAAGPALVDVARRPCAPARAAVGRRVAAELRGRVRARPGRPSPREEAHTGGRVIALIGNLSRDLLPDGTAHVGGGPYHGARALHRLRVPARIVARCAAADRDELLRPVVRLGTPVRFIPGQETAMFSFTYDGDRRRMRIEALGDAWAPTDLPALPSTRWTHVAPLARHEFPVETIAALARRCRVSFDGQGLVRVPEVGPLRLDADFDPELLRYIWVLKLAEEEADVLGDLAALRVREVLITHGSRGATLIVGGRSEHVAAHGIDRDPTGAGDAFMTAYVVARNAGLGPSSAARRATSLVASLLSR